MTTTEDKTAGAKEASRPLVQAVLHASDKNDVEAVQECMEDKGIRKSQITKLFWSVRLPVIDGKKPLFFVRPALKPYCFAFYGAHLFRYWLVEESAPSKFNVRYFGIGDEFSVLRDIHNGMYGIVQTNCNASSCSIVTMHFNGTKYVPDSCQERRYADNGKPIVVPYSCQ